MSREHPATEVYVTGEFDDWGQTVKLEKKGERLFEKLVELPHVEDKVLYKVSPMIFYLVGIWVLVRSRSRYFSYPQGSRSEQHVETWVPLPTRETFTAATSLSLPLTHPLSHSSYFLSAFHHCITSNPTSDERGLTFPLDHFEPGCERMLGWDSLPNFISSF